jgi:hypothetical protein
MKIWFSHCDLDNFFTDASVKLGIGWYRHYKGHKWWGATVEIYLIKWVVMVNYVSNWNEYDKKVNYRKYQK